MKVLLAGASGAIGRRLIPLLVQAGHSVAGTTRTAGKAALIRSLGAEPVVMDALDASAVMAAVDAHRPEVMIHELTAIPSHLNFRKFGQEFDMTNRLRTQGTDNLLAAAHASGVRRFVAQSYAGWPYARQGGPVKSEEDLLDMHPPAGLKSSLKAIRYLEHAVMAAWPIEGVVLRYGSFYGPGTSLGDGGASLSEVRRRRYPIVGSGKGVWSFIHIDDAARATLAAIDHGIPGIYNIVDDEPATVAEWLPALAAAIGAAPPRHVPSLVGRLAVGKHGVVMMTEIRGASNAKAKREMGWSPEWPSWRQGFREGLNDKAVSAVA